MGGWQEAYEPRGCGGSPGLLEGLDLNREFLRDCVQRCSRVSEGSWKVREGGAVLKKKALCVWLLPD